MSSHSHHWHLGEYVPFISQGTCHCGAVKYFANSFEKELVARANELNETQSKEGVMVNNEVKEKQEPVSVAPALIKRRSKYRPRSHFEDNKEAILGDYRSLTIKEFFDKWHLNSNSWTKLKREWGVKGKYKRKAPFDTKVTKVHKGNSVASMGVICDEVNKGLPPFPAFSDTWPMLVQIEWLLTYKELVK